MIAHFPQNACIKFVLDYPGVGGQGKVKGPAGGPGNASPLPLESNSAASSSPAQEGSDYCPGKYLHFFL